MTRFNKNNLSICCLAVIFELYKFLCSESYEPMLGFSVVYGGGQILWTTIEAHEYFSRKNENEAGR